MERNLHFPLQQVLYFSTGSLVFLLPYDDISKCITPIIHLVFKVLFYAYFEFITHFGDQPALSLQLLNSHIKPVYTHVKKSSIDSLTEKEVYTPLTKKVVYAPLPKRQYILIHKRWYILSSQRSSIYLFPCVKEVV